MISALRIDVLVHTAGCQLRLQGATTCRRLLIAALFVTAICGSRPACAEAYDATVGRELTELRQLEFAYHLWLVGDTVHWKRAREIVARGEDVVLDIEPDVSKVEPMPTDPHFAPTAEIKKTHARIAEQLEPLCELAERTGSQVWTYRLLSPTRARAEHIVNDPRAWQVNVQQVVTLEYAPGKTIANLLDSTGGGECCECYVSAGWNVDRPWALAKCVLLIERQRTTLEALGVRSMPLLYPGEIGGKGGPLRTDVWQAMVFTAGRQGSFAVWNGPHQTKDGKPWYKPVPNSHKQGLK